MLEINKKKKSSFKEHVSLFDVTVQIVESSENLSTCVFTPRNGGKSCLYSVISYFLTEMLFNFSQQNQHVLLIFPSAE